MGIKPQVFDIHVTIMYTAQRVNCNKRFSKVKCNIKDVKNICERARHSGS